MTMNTMSQTTKPTAPNSMNSTTINSMKNQENQKIQQFLATMDKCLDGIPAAEVAREHDLDEQAKTQDATIQRLLKDAGIAREAIGPDVLPRLEQMVMDAERDHTVQLEALKKNSRLLDEARTELRVLNAAIAGNRNEANRLTKRIDGLDQGIRDRCVVEKIWYWLFTDEDKMKLEAARHDHAVLQRRLADLRSESQTKSEYRDRLKRKADGVQHEIQKCEDRIRMCDARRTAFRDAVQHAREHGRILREKEGLKTAQKERQDRQTKTWKATVRNLKTFMETLRVRQPRLAGMASGDLGRADAFPDIFLFGNTRFAVGSQTWDVPRVLSFPIPFALRFPVSNDGTAMMREFLLRSFQCLPPASLEITVCDPVRMGRSMEGFQCLLDNRKPFPERAFLTRAKDIENALSRLHTDIADFLQKDCSGEVRDWSSYNAAHPDHPKAYRLLVMFDMDDQLTDTAATYLAKIIENGPRCGILPLLACNPDQLDPHRRKALQNALRTFSMDAVCLRDNLRWPQFQNVRIGGETPSALPDEVLVSDLLRPLSGEYAKRDRFAGTMESLWADEPLWGASSVDGLEAPIGWREDDRTARVMFSLGSKSLAVNHALLGGKTGSGKSNLIHVLLHSLCHRYSPEEFNLYLLDYKESVEFNGYANPLLPHAAGIATESDVEYGLSVLRHLNGEMKRRADVFKETESADIYVYRKKTGLPMPRILLVVDEFQRLFGTAKEGGEAERLLGNLLRQGRSWGIHLLLATQTLHGFQNLASSRSLLSQFSCRIALACTPEDSATLLQHDNLEATSLASPPQGIFNDNQGEKSANVKFIIPEAVAETRKTHLEALCKAAAAQAGGRPSCHVFSGSVLPARPAPAEFASLCAGDRARLLVGRTADFEEQPVLVDLREKNLLVVGRHAGTSGLKQSIAESLGALPGTKSILLYSEHPERWDGLAGAGCAVKRVDDDWDGEGLEEFAGGEAEHKFVVLDDLEDLRALRVTGYVSSRNNSSPAEHLRDLVERPAKSGVRLVLCFRDYARALSTAKDLLSVCEVRLGDGSIQDLAKFAEFDTAGSRGSFDLGTQKALLVDRDAAAPVVFRPFAPREETKG